MFWKQSNVFNSTVMLSSTRLKNHNDLELYVQEVAFRRGQNDYIIYKIIFHIMLIKSYWFFLVKTEIVYI